MLEKLFDQLLQNNLSSGVIVGCLILVVIFLYRRGDQKEKALLEEKDKQINEKDDTLEKVTLVLTAVDNTQKSILIELQKHNEEK